METPDLFKNLENLDDLDDRSLAEHHCQAALAAAREMRSSRQKVRTCREICAHLREMLQVSGHLPRKPQPNNPGRTLEERRRYAE